MDRKGIVNHDRFPISKNDEGKWLCRVCHTPLNHPKTSFCGHKCLRNFFMQTDWQRVRRVIYERDGGICMKCGKKVTRDNYHVDHIIPISKGGSEWDLNNLELACPECNLKKGAKHEDADCPAS